MNYHWNWGIFWELSPDGAHTYFQTLMLGTAVTLITAACAWVIAFTLGSIVGSPAIAGGVLYVGATDGTLYALS